MTLRAATVAIVLLAATPALAAGICNRSQPCDQTAQTQLDITDCAQNLSKEADKKLNELWPKVLGIFNDNYTNASDLKDTLRQAQREWIKFRDTTCQAESNIYQGGSLANLLYVQCTCAVTESRIGDFNRMLSNINN